MQKFYSVFATAQLAGTKKKHQCGYGDERKDGKQRVNNLVFHV